MVVCKLEACHCDLVKLVKEALSQIKRFGFREDITSAKKSIEKTWNEKCKSRNDVFWRHHCNKRLEEILKFFEKAHVFLERSYQVTTVKKPQKKNRQ